MILMGAKGKQPKHIQDGDFRCVAEGKAEGWGMCECEGFYCSRDICTEEEIMALRRRLREERHKMTLFSQPRATLYHLFWELVFIGKTMLSWLDLLSTMSLTHRSPLPTKGEFTKVHCHRKPPCHCPLLVCSPVNAARGC